MLTTRIVTALMLAVGTCAADEASRWKTICYEGFVESIDALTGPSAEDCGLLDRRGAEVGATLKRQSVDCVRAAVRDRRPFKFGTVPPGSNVVYVALIAADQKIWQVRYERSVANKHLHETQINQICANMMLDAEALILHGVECTLVSNGGLPTHVAHPGH